MAAQEEKKRNPNFSKEECALLVKLMGDESGQYMSRHALYKKGFSSNFIRKMFLQLVVPGQLQLAPVKCSCALIWFANV
ncbi:hypothetical protein MAR_019806 [Mya arenaria]|uniref:Uncharacterized protein n=1 Tax=Mya arenaria TaxID=6604 RepID=A0ABY7E6L6_MYAAR|nr:hypothetical protein MAR_019806 [Mya arenaria]